MGELPVLLLWNSLIKPVHTVSLNVGDLHVLPPKNGEQIFKEHETYYGR